MNAPRALPIVSGPVGLAETNSTFTERGRIGATRPQSAGRSSTASIVSSSTTSERRRLMNPGGATTALAIGLPGSAADALRASASASAMASGGRRSGRASFIARFVARSPCSAFAGRSTSTRGRGWSSGNRGKRAGGGCRGPCGLDRLAYARTHGFLRLVGAGRARIGPASGSSPWAANASGRGFSAFRLVLPARPSRESPRFGDRVCSAGPDQSVSSRTAFVCHSLCRAVDIREIGYGNRSFATSTFSAFGRRTMRQRSKNRGPSRGTSVPALQGHSRYCRLLRGLPQALI